MKLIALGHQSRVGKNTVADLIRGFVPKTNIVSFASVLKEEVSQQYGLPDESFFEHYHEARKVKLNDTYKLPNGLVLKDPTIVDLWVAWGDYRRSNELRYFIRKLFDKIDSNKPHVITDLRFKNELEECRLIGKVVLVRRPDAPKNISKSDYELPPDIKWDHVITNDGSLADLKDKVQTMLEELKWLKSKKR
jgi:hypothetical protein